MKRQQHDLNEAECGYRSGNKATALPNEPRFEYDPEETTLNQRLEAKSKETGIAVRTLWRFKNEYRKRGIYALVDLRQVRETKSQFDPRIVQALRFVLAELRDKSNVTRKRIIECPSRPTASPHSTTPSDAGATGVAGRVTLRPVVDRLSTTCVVQSSAQVFDSATGLTSVALPQMSLLPPNPIVPAAPVLRAFRRIHTFVH